MLILFIIQDYSQLTYSYVFDNIDYCPFTKELIMSANEIVTEIDRKIEQFVLKSLAQCIDNFGLFHEQKRSKLQIGSSPIIKQDNIPRLTLADKFAMLMAFTGLYTADETLAGKSQCFGFKDETTGRTVYQVIPLQNFHYSPFVLEYMDKNKATVKCILQSDDIGDCPENLVWELSVSALFRRTSNHHFNQFDSQRNILPVSLIGNPKTSCPEACPGCFRTATKAFSSSSANYIQEHVKLVAEDFQVKFPHEHKHVLQFVSISTGCQNSSQEEVDMFICLMRTYRQFGFNPNFLFFTNKVRRERDMYELKNAGAIGIVSTIEAIDDQIRSKLWGKRKGDRLLIQHLRSMTRANRIFSISEASLVLGEDEFNETLLDGIRLIGDLGSTIVGNVLRSYNEAQLESIHDDVWKMGLEYFILAFEEILMLNSRNTSSAKHLRDIALRHIRSRNGQMLPDIALPYKYRG